MYYTIGGSASKAGSLKQIQTSSLLWKRSDPPAKPNRYNLSSFAITLNELKSDLKVAMLCGINLFHFFPFHAYLLYYFCVNAFYSDSLISNI